MTAYYARRAGEYERIYARPERQAQLAALEAFVEAALVGRDVLELACGTGYFTAVAARRARSVTALDINEETLAIGRAKRLARVSFGVGDAYAPPDLGRAFDGALATFWWSHVPLARLDAFLASLHARLAPGATVVFADNLYVEGNMSPVVRIDACGNTYQRRRLENGEEYEVLKNHPSRESLLACGTRAGSDVQVETFEYYWALAYRMR